MVMVVVVVVMVMSVIMVMMIMPVVMPMVVIVGVVVPGLDGRAAVRTSANRAHHTTSNSRMVISSPPVTCN